VPPVSQGFDSEHDGHGRRLPSWLIDVSSRCGHRANWIIWSLLMLVAVGFYAVKVADGGSAFVRWQIQVLELWKGENIYDEMMFPNPPIMPITLYPLMSLPTVAGATMWFALKVGMTVVSILLCFRMVVEPGRRVPPWAEGLILLLSLRPILSDLHHGNINLLILFLIVTCLYAWRRGFDVLAGLILALAISYKVTPALFFPYFLYKRSWRTAAATLLGLGIFLIIIPSLVLGVDFNARCLSMWWHRILSPYIEHNVGSPQEVNQSMVGVLTRLLTKQPIAPGRYRVHRNVNFVAWAPGLVIGLIKLLSIWMVGLLAYLCRTKTGGRRDDPRLFGEFALVVLTMLIVSERSWKHHFVTLLLPYTYLGYRVTLASLSPRVRWLLGGSLLTSAVLIASTSSELGGLFVKGGHKVALDYGMFLWAAAVLYAATAWRVRVEGRDRPGQIVGRKIAPHQPHIAD
jgi:alpha-1,2-mannosyltransferase